jgi:hypothetical protein
MDAFQRVLREMLLLHQKKQQDYGSRSDAFANVRASEDFGIPGWLGAIIRANDKMSRMKSFAETGVLANESVEDSLIDMANYAVIALVLYREETEDGNTKAMDGAGSRGTKSSSETRIQPKTNR